MYIYTMVAAMLLFTILDKIVIGLGAAAILDYCASSGTKYLIFLYHELTYVPIIPGSVS